MYLLISAIMNAVVPVILFFFLRRHHKVSWKAVGLGALFFFVAQIFKAATGLAFPHLTGMGFAVFAAVLPGFWEEVAKYLPLKWAKSKTWNDVLDFGFGFGGFECIYIGINLGVTSAMLLFAPDQLPAATRAALEAMVPTSLALAVAGPLLERFFAMWLHTGFSFLNATALKTRRLSLLCLAMVLHFLADLPAGMYQTFWKGNVGALLLIEAWIAVLALASIWFVRRSLGAGEFRQAA